MLIKSPFLAQEISKIMVKKELKEKLFSNSVKIHNTENEACVEQRVQ